VDTLSYKTVTAQKTDAQPDWYLVDAEAAILGRLVSEVAKIAKGKHKPNFAPNVICRDHVVIINADKIKLTGKKMSDKVYVRHTTYPGGQRFTTPKDMMRKSSRLVIEHALKGMLPKNSLGRRIFHNVHIFEGANHPHEAQSPKPITLAI
jgi:large subunit ribosomal protein L13